MGNPRHALSATTKEAYRTALRFFHDAHGDLEPRGITRTKVAEWLDLSAQRPSRLPQSERKLPLRVIVARYEDKGDTSRLTGKTIEQQHLASLSTLWSKAAKDGAIPQELANPFRGHTVPQGPRKRRPKGSSEVELQTIFSLLFSLKGERPKRGKGEASYWLPLLLLWTGARPDEVAQLLVTDVFWKETSKRWGLKITDEGTHPHKGQRRLKTDEGEREFPIPQPLIDLGSCAMWSG